ncbi:MAG: sugar phosphate isomerase/epimerase family protein, partial [Spirochaetota bacterium]|nr:sugar phosphate isomerase/epimerase family protein [Spirochaetota bacterium]
EIGEAGFDFLDLTIEGPDAMNIDVVRVGELINQYNLSVVGHTDPCLPYAYPSLGIRVACLNDLEKCAKIFSALNAKVMNIHPCYFFPPAMMNEIVELNTDALKPIVEMADSYGLKLAIENFKEPFDSVSTFKRLLEEVPGLYLHLDFGHANMGSENGESFCKALGRHIAHVHFNDNRSTGDHHMPLGVGSVNWRNAVSALKSTGYDDTITLEIFCDDVTLKHRYLEISKEFVMSLWE